MYAEAGTALGGKATAMERRKYNRISALLDAEEQVFIENGAQLVPSTLMNFAPGGALVELKDSGAQFPEGETFHILFDHGGELLELDATALRTDGTNVAFKFGDLSDEQRRAIHTKIIRMAIISARIHPKEQKPRNGQSAGSEISQSERQILVGQQS